VQSGRVFSAGEIAQIRETVAWLPKLPRTELAATVCEHLRWHTVTGTPKVQACGQLLARLETAGLVQLPALRARPPRRTPRRCRMPTPCIGCWRRSTSAPSKRRTSHASGLAEIARS
jgi:hypothetical protein